MPAADNGTVNTGIIIAEIINLVFTKIRYGKVERQKALV